MVSASSKLHAETFQYGFTLPSRFCAPYYHSKKKKKSIGPWGQSFILVIMAQVILNTKHTERP